MKKKFVHAVWTVLLAFSLILTSDPAMAAAKKRIAPAPAPTTPKVEATWVWNTYQIAYEKDQLLQFAKENGVNLIYLQILLNGDITNEHYRTFIREAGLLGIEVRALDGRPEWALPENRYHITNLVNWVKQYNASVATNERFRGIHLDVEPYILPQWSTDQASVVTAWMDTVNMFTTQVKQDSALKTSADIPAWLEHIPTPNNTGTLSRFMISKYDQVTLMAYRDVAQGTDGILTIVQKEIAEANALGKTLVVGVNIIVDPEGDMISFAEEGKAEMEKQIALVYSGLQGNASFAGHAVHDYNSWRNARP